MKALFIGLGSAGQRHLRNLKSILGDEVDISAFRVGKLTRMFDDQLNIVEGQDIAAAYHIREYSDLKPALSAKPDVVFITNPNSMHMKCAIEAAYAGCDMFIEKPISNSFDQIDDLLKIAEKRKLKVYIGYQHRLHPCLKHMKEALELGKIGRTLSVHCEVGELLTKMHQYEDYRRMNEAQQQTGGGVVLCQIHELDYLYWIFGLPQEIYSIGGNYSDMEIDVEDMAVSICKYKRQGYEFPIVIHQDFIQYPPVRRCKVVGEYGRIEVDLKSNSYGCYEGDKLSEEILFDKFNRNDMFVEEMQLFLECVKNRTPEYVTIQDALGSLKMAIAIKESICTGEKFSFVSIGKEKEKDGE